MKKNKALIPTSVKKSSANKYTKFPFDFSVWTIPFAPGWYLIKPSKTEKMILIDMSLIAKCGAPETKPAEEAYFEHFKKQYLDFCKYREGLKRAKL